MRKRELTETEFNEIIKLRSSGSSWLSIERTTSVPRRSAKRAYENWQREQATDELKAARLRVATEMFREHIRSLIKLADSLSNHLALPQWETARMSADRFLSILWETDVLSELQTIQSLDGGGVREPQQVIRRNKLLFKSLRQHTREHVRWSQLDEWQVSWDRCIELVAE